MKNVTLKGKICSVLAVISLVVFFFLKPFSDTLTVESMRVMGILIAAIFMWIGGAVHECAVALLMAALFAAFGKVPVETVFGAFNGSVVWVLIPAFVLGAAMKSCGLLTRVALVLLKIFPKNFVGVNVGCAIVGAVIAPFVPSKNAKGAILGPVLRSVNDNMGFKPKSKQSNALFLSFWTTTIMIPLIFISGSTTTVASRGFLPEEYQNFFTTAKFGMYAAPLAIIVSVLMVVYLLVTCKPKKGEATKKLDTEFLNEQLKALGPMKREEKIVGIGAVVMVLYWIFKQYLGNIPDYASCIIICCVFWFTGCMNAKDFRTGVAWENMFFIGICISLGNVLPYVHITDWIVEVVTPITNAAFSGPVMLILVLSVILFLVRFVLISEGSYMSVLCALLYPLAIAAGVNPFIVAMILNSLVSGFCLPYMSSSFLSCYYAYGEDVYDTKANISYNIVFLFVHLIAMFACYVIWNAMGVWYI